MKQVKKTEGSSRKRKHAPVEISDGEQLSDDNGLYASSSKRKMVGSRGAQSEKDKGKGKGKGKGKPTDKKRINASENKVTEVSEKTRTPMARKGKVVVDGIEDEDVGESDAYVDDE